VTPTAQETVDFAIDFSAEVRQKWDDLSLVTQRGQREAAEVIHGVFFYYLLPCFDTVRVAQQLAESAARYGGQPLPGADRLPAVLTDLESLRREALADWQYPLPDPSAGTGLPPVWMDEHDDIYAGRSRVRLDTIIEEYESGASPEDIAGGYDTLSLADVQDVISYYLRHQKVVDAYLRRREAEAEKLRQEVEDAQPLKAELKAQIKERWSRRKTPDASLAE